MRMVSPDLWCPLICKLDLAAIGPERLREKSQGGWAAIVFPKAKELRKLGIWR